MRLAVLERGHSRRNRFALRAMRTLVRAEPDDVVKTSLYRPGLFGRPWIALLRETMRGASPWTAGERELMGAFTSRLNDCPYCTATHCGTAALALGTDVTGERLDGWRDGRFGDRVTAAFTLLEALDPAADAATGAARLGVAAARSAGRSDAEIEDALQVQFVFNVVNRAANALGYAWRTEADQAAGIRTLHRFGYRLPGLLLR